MTDVALSKEAEVTAIADLPVDPSTPLFSIRPFALLLTTRVTSNTSNQMLAVAVGYQIYELTDSPLHLGLIGLVQFLPPLLLMLFAGQVADRYNRRLVVRFCYAVEFCMTAGLTIVALLPHPNIGGIYGLLLINAIARTFEQPAVQSLVPVMAPRAVLGRAIAAHVSAGRLSMLLGPSLGGVLYIFGPGLVYSVCTLLVSAAAVASFLLPNPPVPKEPQKLSWDSLLAGFKFIWRCQAVLGAMSFDLIATLLGGVSALLPIYARDILHIGAWGAGILRSAPALGALSTALVLARIPVRRNGGVFIFAGFALYGTGAVVFGLSTNVVLSIASLMVLGCGDIMSSIVRQTIVQITTPDEMRGRVMGVNSFFIGCSGQLGSFRAGLMAAMIGAVGSVVVGGCTVFVVIALWAWLFPDLRRVDRPDEAQPY
ncbi:MAG TPA: MFS transporter [Xanthobacteraceae bacterium]